MLHHVMSRGTDRREMFVDDVDYARYLHLLERSARRFCVAVNGYCLMPNHVHLLLRPTSHPLARLMQHVNSAYCGWFNRRHGRVGHVLQGRYKAQIVEGGPSSMRVLRYVMLNPVAAGLVARAAEWRWSSFRSTAGMDSTPTFLTLDDMWQTFDPADRGRAQDIFQRFVDGDDVSTEPSGGLVVGSDGFIRSFGPLLSRHRENREFVHAERFAARPSLRDLVPEIKRGSELHQAASSAFHVHAFTLREIAEHVAVSPSAVWVWTRRAQQAALD
jgi:REP element-mobilizing transposase RayT